MSAYRAHSTKSGLATAKPIKLPSILSIKRIWKQTDLILSHAVRNRKLSFNSGLYLQVLQAFHSLVTVNQDIVSVLKGVLRNWNLVNWTRLRGDLREFQKFLCGTELRYEKEVIDNTNFVRVFVGDVALERFNNGVRQRTAIPKKHLNP